MEIKKVPHYQRIARQLKSAIEHGELAPGSRLPASRVYAQELGVSRATVENAWGELVAQGWLERRGQAGTFVSERLSPLRGEPARRPTDIAPTAPQPFQLGLPALDLFPRGLWARVMGRRLRTQTRFDLAPGDPCGEMILRRAIVDYLRLSRSIECLPEQVLVTGNYAASMRLLLRTLAQPGQHMWMEDPGFPLIRPVITGEGGVIDPVPVDEEGMDVAWAQRHYPDAHFALLTPAHQSPLGVALSLSRRRQLLAWAARHDAWIIEDDYDSEFRYRGKPLPPLKSLDAPQRVIYAGSFSKSLFPALRAAWLVVPLPQVAAFRQQAELMSCSVPTLWQQTLADFIHEGHFWRHLKKMRTCYAQRRQWLESALLAQGFSVVPQLGGIQLVITVNGDDRALAVKARQAGLSVQALSDWRMQSRGEGGLLVSFTNLTSMAMATEAVRLLKVALFSADRYSR
ncbi:PLP-dependent aminotransferase family protein [Raoultella planticola]|jgi:GntR family transcriptional regulator/MocR family aminotransferase|uniref:MocR-like pyridoxine biosynthesis transcription factor PdxR n=1 Tax=Raoultella planticola TaxID=575 RepID=UPI000BFAE60F|nr:PLP-dependent aminotransferase family protein [Raoultella planticola]AUU02791.1 DNA-binding transcriptional regulator [Raoultella planticola]EIY2676026.1 PLP-dependent aminotransferase family protein [Raoultella planticola]ELT9609442.1 PLP-dependent aminotransferase family protein [Raoultella planticola]PNK79589.1 DNA-binding transcriptional regulator [Raoultella planticola]VTM74626.1 HTH-type transcriptional regulatory protein gabR [Raoultella planticola]